jgi:6-phosphogluconolactonase
MDDARIDISADLPSLVTHVADWLTQAIENSHGNFALALSGGSTPRPLYELLATPAYTRRIDWQRVHLFWGDERFVPYDDAASNYRMAKVALIDRIPIPAGNVHPMPTDGDPASAAQRYAQTLQSYYGSDTLDPGRPLFDVNLLGIGDDGHTASLFPTMPTIRDDDPNWVIPIQGYQPKSQPQDRITLTLPVLGSARTVAFLVSGAGKRTAVSRALKHDGVPSGRVRSVGELVWFLDRAAAPEGV